MVVQSTNFTFFNHERNSFNHIFFSLFYRQIAKNQFHLKIQNWTTFAKGLKRKYVCEITHIIGEKMAYRKR